MVLPTMEETLLYMRCLKETLERDGPGKCQEFLQVMLDREHSRIDTTTTAARAYMIVKDHWYLILGFAVYVLKKYATTGLAMDDAVYYMASVKEAFHNEPSKYLELLNILFTAHRVDEASVIAKLQKLMKGHPNLLLGLNLFLPSEPKITVSSKTEPDSKERKKVEPFFSFEPKRTIFPKTDPVSDQRQNAESLLSFEPKITISHKTEPDSKKRKHGQCDGGGLMNKLKTRSQSHETDAAQAYQN